jgi:hypothetical protein
LALAVVRAERQGAKGFATVAKGLFGRLLLSGRRSFAFREAFFCLLLCEALKADAIEWTQRTSVLCWGMSMLLCRLLGAAFFLCFGWMLAGGQAVRGSVDLTRQQTYTVHRVSSSDVSGANRDSVRVAAGGTASMMDVDGPGQISHIWITASDSEKYFLKRLVLRMYWDDEATPSVEVPLGDFFGLNTGEYAGYESAVLSVGGSRSLNSFFPMPFRKHARITLTNEGTQPLFNLFFNIEYRAGPQEADAKSMYFHAQYRQAAPLHGWTNEWYDNGDFRVNRKENLDGKDNYVFMEATGRGHYVGLTLGVVQNQDGWWGEGDEMLFVDSPDKPTISGTGSEDYFLGAWDFESKFAYQTYGAPLVGSELAGSHNTAYRFHLDSPIPFTKSFKGTIEHGNANHRSDNYYSVAYWYQAEPHAPFPQLPPVEQRLPAIMPVTGPGNGPQQNVAPPFPPPAVPSPGTVSPTANPPAPTTPR